MSLAMFSRCRSPASVTRLLSRMSFEMLGSVFKFARPVSVTRQWFRSSRFRRVKPIRCATPASVTWH